MTVVRTNASFGGASWAMRVAMGLALALAIGASVIRGGNRSVPLVGLEWLALGILALMGSAGLLAGRWPGGWGKPGSAGRWGLVLLALFPLGLAALSGLGSPNPMPLANWAGGLGALPVVAMLAIGVSASPAQTRALWLTWLSVALVQALLGFLQLGGLDGLRFDMAPGEKLIGSFASKNTYSNFMVMAIPLAVFGLLAPQAREGQRNRPWLWGAALFVLLAAISMSTSRTGIATGLLSVVLSVALLAPARQAAGAEKRRGSGRRWLWLGAAALIAAVALAGGLDWVDRFDSAVVLADDARRGLMREATWQGAMAYWPWGSGLGSYRWVFPPFHPSELGNYLIDMAHNDYLQLMMELGIGFVLMAALALALVARRVWALWAEARRRRGKGWCEADRLAVACGLGALATALHALVDYPFHIPANAMFAAFLLGVFLREPLKSTHEAG